MIRMCVLCDRERDEKQTPMKHDGKLATCELCLVELKYNFDKE